MSVKDYVAADYEPEALVNFLAFLGWNPGTDEELFSLEALVDAFDLDRVVKTGAQFNIDKLRWYQEHYLRALSPEALAARVRPYVDAAGYAVTDAYLAEVCALLSERIAFPADVLAEHRYFFEAPQSYDEKGVKKRWKDDSARLVRAYADALETAEPFDLTTAEAALRLITGEELGAGRLIHPARLAITGATAGPGLFELMVLLGREACMRRLRVAAEVLG